MSEITAHSETKPDLLRFIKAHIRDYALPIDARDLARDVLRHRVVLSYEALADGVSADDLLTPILDSIALPDLPLRERQAPAGGPPWTTRHP